MSVAVARIRFLSDLKQVSLPFWILQVFLFLGYTSADEEWTALLQLRPRLLLGGLILLLAGVRLFGPTGHTLRARLESDRRLVWLVAFTVAALLSTVWAFDTAAARAEFQLQFILMLAYPLVVVLVRTRQELYLALLVLCAGHGFLLLRAFTEYFGGRISSSSGLPRMMGVGQRLADPNSFAAVVVFVLPIMAWLGSRARSGFVRVGALAYAALGAIAVVLTYSRSGAVMLALCFLWMLILLRGRTRLVLVAVLLLGALGAAQREDGRTVKRLSTLTSSSTYNEEQSTQGRIDGYRIAWRMAEARPLLGVGPGCWSQYRMQRVDGNQLRPHNLWGQILGTHGSLGALTFAGYLFAALWLGFRVRKRLEDPLLRSLAAPILFTLGLMLLSGLAAHNLARELWFLLPAFLVVAARIDAESRPETPIRD